MRKHAFVVGEYYHIYNRGTDKRQIFLDQEDLDRFIKSLIEFNRIKPIGSLYEMQFSPKKKTLVKSQKLVSIIAFCLNPNHFHLILTPLTDGGIEKFMQKIAGYTRYFNEKYERSGVLFQGKFQSKHIDNNDYLLRVSSYVNLNNRDPLGTSSTKWSKSSWEEYLGKEVGICDIDIILKQFKKIDEYRTFALECWNYSQELKEELDK